MRRAQAANGRRWVPALLAGALLLVAPACAQEERNLAANPGFEEGAAGWNVPPTYAVTDEQAHSGTRSLRVTSTDANTYRLANRAISVTPGRRYAFGAWVKTRGVQGDDSGATVCVEWNRGSEYLGGSYPAGHKGDTDWRHVEGQTGPIPEGADRVSLTLYLRKGMTGTAWFDDVHVRMVYPPALDAALLLPNYRGRLDPSDPNARVLVRASVGDYLPGGLRPEQTTLALALRQGDVEIRRTVAKRPRAGDHSLALDARKLAPGAYQAAVTLSAPDGTPLGERAFDLEVPAPGAPRPAVFIDRHNRCVVEGKPFFPLGWYFGPGPGSPGYQAHLDRVAASPFNTIMCYGVNSGSIETVRAYLEDLHRRKLKILYSIKDVYEGTQYYLESVLNTRWRGEDAIVEGVANAFRNHPALLGWYLNDELPLSMRDRLEARYQQVRRLDPNHPTWSVLYQVGDLRDYLGTADVLGTDPYPVGRRPVTMAADWTRRSSDASGGFRPLWQVPQAHDWACYDKANADKLRAPTLDEEMVMSYLCLIHGANGLIYYSYTDLQRDRLGFDRRWADMLVVGSEVKQLFPALLSTAPPPKLAVQRGSAAVHLALRADDAGRQYVLMANPDPERGASVQVNAPAGRSAELLRNAHRQGMARPADGRYQVTLPPMGAATLILLPRAFS